MENPVMRYPMNSNAPRMNALNRKGVREVHDDELLQTEGGGWFKDAVNALQDWAGFEGSEDSTVAAGTRN